MVEEAPLTTDIQICDPHHHLWEYPDSVYLLDDLRADIGGFPVTRTVFVECGSAYRTEGPEAFRPVGETEWVAAMAPDDGPMAAIVGFADLSLGAVVSDVLAAHIEAGRGRFRGVRHASAWDPSPEIRRAHSRPPPRLFGIPSFRDGFAALDQAGLSFDAWLYFPQLPELVDLARAFPEVVIVLDHLGGPIAIGPYAVRREEMLTAWRASMRELATCENVVLKLGGIGMSVYGMQWHHRDEPPSSAEVAAAWGAEIHWCIELFGVERCMFESNFPVDRNSFGYATCWNAFLRMTEDLSRSERRSLFSETATRTYRI